MGLLDRSGAFANSPKPHTQYICSGRCSSPGCLGPYQHLSTRKERHRKQVRALPYVGLCLRSLSTAGRCSFHDAALCDACPACSSTMADALLMAVIAAEVHKLRVDRMLQSVNQAMLEVVTSATIAYDQQRKDLEFWERLRGFVAQEVAAADQALMAARSAQQRA